MRVTLLLPLACIICATCHAQQLKYTAFTVNDGLPSNYIYRCVEDDKGFLWVATDAGVARFDGKHFQVFTTKEGLPDNDVLAVVKENNGRIWANCFKQIPAYFDEIQNRFVTMQGDSILAKAKAGTGIMYAYPLREGGIMFTNEKNTFIFKNGKPVDYYQGRNKFFIKNNSDGSCLRWGINSFDTLHNKYPAKIYQIKGTTYIDSISIKQFLHGDYTLSTLDDGKLFIFNFLRHKCYVYSNLNVHPLSFSVDSIEIPEPLTFFGVTKTWVNFYASSGKISVFDKKTLQPLFTISGKYSPNALYNDNNGNIWISTLDKGLILYKKKKFANVAMPNNFTNTSFLSIVRNKNGVLLAGNFYGQVLQASGKSVYINAIPNQTGGIMRQRKILLSQNKVFTFSEAGIFVNYSKQFLLNPKRFYYAKTALNYNDSIIITGNVSGMQKINTVTEKISTLHPFITRVTAMAKARNGMVYYGSTNGLYEYDYVKDTGWPLTNNSPLLGERITAICSTEDSLVWIATSGNGVIAIKHDTVLLHITENEGIISNATRSLTAAKPGQVWLGTGYGISVINYTFTNNKVKYAIQNLSANDGLTNNLVNEMVYANDTIYAATGDGVSIIPVNTYIPKFNIPVQLTSMRINQHDTVIVSTYNLGYDQRNIQMQFAGIELSGHFKSLQYTLDGNKNWTGLDESILALQLNSGRHTIQVRAIDVNNNISDKILAIQLNIATPFWKAIWFWFLIALTFQSILLYTISKRQRKKREAKLAKEIEGVQTAALEQQALTSLMNPHFLFNALNSIQHYINVQDRQNANRYLSDFASLIRKNFEAAQKSFIVLEQELENIKIYLRLEQMRFAGRFCYQINVAENIDTDAWMVPTMVLQPFLENAVLHGIMPSTIEGEIIVAFEQLHNLLAITITDNGIGIANSLALNEKNGHKSLGMKLIEKRIAALGRFGKIPMALNIFSAFNDEKNPGTKITLIIPDGLYNAWLHAGNKR